MEAAEGLDVVTFLSLSGFGMKVTAVHDAVISVLGLRSELPKENDTVRSLLAMEVVLSLSGIDVPTMVEIVLSLLGTGSLVIVEVVLSLPDTAKLRGEIDLSLSTRTELEVEGGST